MPTIKTKSPRRPWMPEHKPFERSKPNSAFYTSPAWRALRNKFIQQHPLCEMCIKEGRMPAAAMVVDHIVPINKGGAPLNPENLQALCASCHNRKSAKEDK
ncbi:MAG: HNH endonuclease [Bacteroidales bacterium]|nr:HNH endonuclease [Bacteroidales bacterium]